MNIVYYWDVVWLDYRSRPDFCPQPPDTLIGIWKAQPRRGLRLGDGLKPGAESFAAVGVDDTPEHLAAKRAFAYRVLLRFLITKEIHA